MPCNSFCTACVVFFVPRIDGDGATTFEVRLALGGHPRPILRRADGSVTLVGILWGGGTGTFAFSPLRSIKDELGNFTAH